MTDYNDGLSGIRDVLKYDPELGKFFWRKNYYRHKEGKEAGHVKKNYMAMKWKDKHFSMHRLAFFFMTGNLPDMDVDHINGDPMDNR